MRIHRDGLGTIAGIWLVCLGIMFLISWLVKPIWIVVPICVILTFLMCFILYFFRVPVRRGNIDSPKAVTSVADGEVVIIEKVFEEEYLKKECIQISVYMNFFNMHVNFWPVTGTCTYYKYHPGKYFLAFMPKASELNEHTSIAMKTEDGQEIFFKQIAGTFARRIVCKAKEGVSGERGRQCGLIKFGSRIDLFVPLDADIKVEVGDDVVACLSVLAELKYRRHRRGGIFAFEHGGTGHEDVCAAFHEFGGVLRAHAAVHFNHRIKAATVNLLPDGRYPLVGIFDERLSAETGKDRHDDHEIADVEIGIEFLDRNIGIDGQTGLHPVVGNDAEHRLRIIPGRIQMETHQSGVGNLAETLQIDLRVLNHQVDIQRLLRDFGHCLDNGKAVGNVGHETAVHHIQVEQVGMLVHHPYVLFEMQEVCREHRGGDQRSHIQRLTGLSTFSISATYWRNTLSVSIRSCTVEQA